MCEVVFLFAIFFFSLRKYTLEKCEHARRLCVFASLSLSTSRPTTINLYKLIVICIYNVFVYIYGSVVSVGGCFTLLVTTDEYYKIKMCAAANHKKNERANKVFIELFRCARAHAVKEWRAWDCARYFFVCDKKKTELKRTRLEMRRRIFFYVRQLDYIIYVNKLEHFRQRRRQTHNNCASKANWSVAEYLCVPTLLYFWMLPNEQCA